MKGKALSYELLKAVTIMVMGLLTGALAIPIGFLLLALAVVMGLATAVFSIVTIFTALSLIFGGWSPSAFHGLMVSLAYSGVSALPLFLVGYFLGEMKARRNRRAVTNNIAAGFQEWHAAN